MDFTEGNHPSSLHLRGKVLLKESVSTQPKQVYFIQFKALSMLFCIRILKETNMSWDKASTFSHEQIIKRQKDGGEKNPQTQNPTSNKQKTTKKT